jgi:hypothetical protein
MCEEVTFIETYCLPKANEEIHIRSPVTTTNIRSIFEPENSRILSNAFHIHTAAYRGIWNIVAAYFCEEIIEIKMNINSKFFP